MIISRVRNILDLNRFNEDAKASNVKIEIVMKHGDDDLQFTISEELTPAEDVLLDDLVTNFMDSDPEDKIPKIYDLVIQEARHKHHHNIDYKVDIKSGSNLIPKRVVDKGEVTRVEWFMSLDANQVPIGLVLTVDVVYVRDATGFATYRTTTRTWVNRDDTLHEEKKYTSKFYFVNPSDMITEGYKRRKLLVQSIQIPALTFMMETLMPLGYTQTSVVLLGRAFMDDYDQDFNKFVENSSTITDPADPNVGKKTIIVEFEDTTIDGRNKDYNLWMDKAPASLGGMTTIRQYLISEFDI